MNPRNLFLSFSAVLGGIALSACSNDKTPDVQPEGRAVRFAAQAPALTRAGETTTSNLTEFSVYAYTLGKPFMENVDVKKTAENTWEYSPVVYWPVSPVNFYAFAPTYWDDIASDGTSAGSNSVYPEGSTDYYSLYGNTDLVYAVSMGLQDSNSPVLLNFRHALSQVQVDLRTDLDPSAYSVKVSAVHLMGVSTTGSFQFPQATTVPGGEAKGSWSNQSGDSAYVFYVSGESPEKGMQLTSDAQNVNVVSQGFMVPQELTTASLFGSGSEMQIDGEYIAVDFVIYNAAGAQIWPNSNTPSGQIVKDGLGQPTATGRIYFPVIAENVPAWEQGTRYVYTLTINEPASLNEIVFGTPTVDSYSEVSVPASN